MAVGKQPETAIVQWHPGESTGKDGYGNSGADIPEEAGGSGDIIDPTDIPGCTLWLDASQLTLDDDDPVATWPDLSVNGYDATQTTNANQPVCKTGVQNGLRVVRFDSSSDYPQYLALSGNALALLNAAAGVSVFAVAGRIPYNVQLMAVTTDTGAARRVYFALGGTSGAIADVFVGASNDDSIDADNVLSYSSGNGNTPTTVVTVAVGAANLVDLEATVEVSSGQIDSSGGAGGTRAGTPGAIPDTNAFAIHIGGDNTEPGPAILTGDLMELAVFTRALNARERRQLMEYGSAKWATL